MISIVLENITNRLLFVGGILTESGYIGKGFKANQFTISNARQVDIDALPDDAVIGVSSYNELDDAWVHPTSGPDFESKLEALKEQRCTDIDAKRDAIFYSNVPYNAKEIQFRNHNDFIRLSSLMDAVRDGAPSIQVIMADNSIETIPAADYTTLWTNGVARNSQASLNARTLKNSVLAATSFAAVNEVDITTGWPI